MAETLIQWTQSPPLPHDVVLPRTMRVPGLNGGKALPKGHILPAGSRVGGYTHNRWLGCAKVSPGCAHCYAEKDMAVTMRQGGKVKWGPTAQRVLVSETTRRRPLAWNRVAEDLGVPLFVFAQSLSDTFEDRADLEGWRIELFELIRQTPNLRWLLLTKRPEVMARFAAEHGWPENAWAGCTVEDQRRADERLPWLAEVPAPVRFLSCEPLLGPLDLVLDFRLDWVIIGGESGPHARPMHPDWARSLIRQGQEAGVAVHFKQWGEHVPLDGDAWEMPAGWDDVALDEQAFTAHGHRFAKVGKKAAGRVIDGRTWDEIPEVRRG